MRPNELVRKWACVLGEEAKVYSLLEVAKNCANILGVKALPNLIMVTMAEPQRLLAAAK